MHRSKPCQGPNCGTGLACAQSQHPPGHVLNHDFGATECEFAGTSRGQVDLTDRNLLGQSQRIRRIGAMRRNHITALAWKGLNHFLWGGATLAKAAGNGAT